MEQTKLDRRERRTRQLLSEALLALIQEKRYEAITVQDIIDRADVGRSTFYAHYRDKDDLFAVAFEGVMEQLLGGIEAGGEGGKVVPTLQLFRHFQENHQLYWALARSRGMDTLNRAMRDFLTQLIERRIARMVGRTQDLAVPLPILSDYLAGALLNLTHWWFEHRMPYPPEQMDEIYQRLVMPGLSAAISRDPMP
jgi:AcrR family transcriptional regulator